MTPRNENGQAVMEMLFVFPLGVLLFTLILWSAVSGWSIFWVEFQLQEAVVCLSDSSAYECQQSYKKIIKQGATFLTISFLSLEKHQDRLYGSVQFSFPFTGKQSFKLEKTIPWPITE